MEKCEIIDFDNQRQLDAAILTMTEVVARGAEWAQGYVLGQHVLMSLGPNGGEE